MSAEQSDQGFVIEKLLQIANKEGDDVDFILNSAQRKLDAALTGRDLVPKARQEGVSSYVLARFLIDCLSKRNTRAVVISHESEATARMLERVRYYTNHIKGPPPVIQRSSANLMTFPKTDSMFYIGTAGSKKFGRGDTITRLHGSEYAYWPNPKELIRGLFQAVPMGAGEIILESTGNGFNDYHSRCMRAHKGLSDWTCHFLPWTDFTEYQVSLSKREKQHILDTINKDWEEDNLVGRISLEQMAWRRIKLEEMDYDLRSFKQEYPETLEECFQASSSSIFHRVCHIPTALWQRSEEDHHMWFLEGHPNRGCTYSLGSDVSAGVELDASVMEIICLETMSQVGEWIDDKTDPEQLAYKIRDVGEQWGFPFVTVESNNHGILTLDILSKIYPQNLIYKTAKTKTTDEEKKLHHLGWRSSQRSKPLQIGRLRSVLAHGGLDDGEEGIVIHSDILRDECSTYIEHPDTGRLGAQDGCHDDTVVAMACSVMGMGRAGMHVRNKIREARAWADASNPFTLDSMLNDLHGSGQLFPIAPQHDLS